MFPSHSQKTFITASISMGPNPEPNLTSRDFLTSLLDYGIWLRPLAAKKHLEVIESSESSEIEKLSSLASFYQLAGQITEDALTAYIAWIIWAKNKEQSLPDIYERLSLRFSNPTKPVVADYLGEIFSKISSTNKRVDIYPREFLTQFLKFPVKTLPELIGIAWKRDPSVKLVPKDLRPSWDNLGDFINELLLPLIDNKGALLASCYNKIKHGPQVLISSPRDAAIMRGFSKGQVEEIQDYPAIRLLLEGGRLQETEDEYGANIRVSPYIVAEPQNLRRWFFQQVVHTSNGLSIVGTWILNTTYMGCNRPLTVRHPEVQSIIREQGAHLNKTFGGKST